LAPSPYAAAGRGGAHLGPLFLLLLLLLLLVVVVVVVLGVV